VCIVCESKRLVVTIKKGWCWAGRSQTSEKSPVLNEQHTLESLLADVRWWCFYNSTVITSRVFVFADLTFTEQQSMSEYTQIIYCVQMRDLPQVSKHFIWFYFKYLINMTVWRPTSSQHRSVSVCNGFFFRYPYWVRTEQWQLWTIRRSSRWRISIVRWPESCDHLAPVGV